MRRVLILVLLIALGLCAELWVNAIRDPGAELGAGDWKPDIYEVTFGDADSAEINFHDTTRAFEGNFSFLTDTKTDRARDNAECRVSCKQTLTVQKAISDIDSCFWAMYLSGSSFAMFHLTFRSKYGKNIWWVSGSPPPGNQDTLYKVLFPLPDINEWTEYGVDFYTNWVDSAEWNPGDTVIEVWLSSWGSSFIGAWMGQEVSWDNIILRSIAYYDYATESIDSDPWESVPRSYTPIATFANKGKLDDFSTYVYSEIYRHDNQEVVFKDSAELSIPSDGSEQVTFATYQHDGGSAGYTLRVFPVLENDELSTDDTLELELMASITEQPDAERLLTTQRVDGGVQFSFAQGIRGNLAIYDVSGREVYSHIVESGIREHLWSTVDISSGLYFYKFDSGESLVAGKLVIFK